jgi:16S rRNA (cytosine1402-N4)-methyltransferase
LKKPRPVSPPSLRRSRDSASEQQELKYPHRPVMVHEVIEDLITLRDGVYVDGTVGNGGHSEAILRGLGEEGRLIGLDRDPEAIRVAGERLAPFGEKIRLVKTSYADLDRVMQGFGIETVRGVFLDLGMSTSQLDDSRRGFSFSGDEPLDMRMDTEEGETARDLLKNLSARELEHIFKSYGEEKRGRIIAKRIEGERRKSPLDSTLQLVNLILSVVPRSRRPGAKHPATKTFQALRIVVNRELEHLAAFLEKAPRLISERGRLVVLTYHSLEDRMVKQAIQDWEKGCRCPSDLPACACGKEPLFRRLHKKGVKPGQWEVEENPRSRSATLRAAERI